MNILILGGNGFLGSHLCKIFALAGHHVRVFDRVGSRTSIELKSGVEHFVGDFNNAGQIESALHECDVVVHLVSTTLPQTSNDDPLFDIHTNLNGTIHLLQEALRLKVKKVLFASSGGTVYGIPQATPITEDHSTEPICSYGIVKLAIEKYLALFERLYGLNYGVLRISNPYGEGQSPERRQGAIAVFAHQALNGEVVNVWGDGTVIRDYVYVGDVARAFLKALTYQGTQRVFNIGSGVGQSINEILQVLENIIGQPVRRNYIAARSFDVPINVLDIKRARDHLFWMPSTDLNAGIVRALEWQRHCTFNC